MKISFIVATFLAGAILAAPSRSKAGGLSFGLDAQFQGSVPPGATAPWVTATFSNGAPDTVLLTVTASSLSPGADLRECYFNFDPTKNLGALNIVQTNGGLGTVTVLSINRATNGYPLDGTGGQADIRFRFVNSTFSVGKSCVFAITGIAGLNADMFNAASANAVTGPWYSAAEIMGVPCPDCGGTTLAWIGDATSVPGISPPYLTILPTQDSESFGFEFTNAQSASFEVLSTTNLTLPLTDWPVIGAASNIGAGSFQFIISTTNDLQRFFIVRPL